MTRSFKAAPGPSNSSRQQHTCTTGAANCYCLSQNYCPYTQTISVGNNVRDRQG